MSNYLNFFGDIERRKDDFRLADQSRQGAYIPAGAILTDRLIKTLSTVPRSARLQISSTSRQQFSALAWLGKQLVSIAGFFLPFGIARTRRAANRHSPLYAHHYKLAHKQHFVHVRHH